MVGSYPTQEEDNLLETWSPLKIATTTGAPQWGPQLKPETAITPATTTEGDPTS